MTVGVLWEFFEWTMDSVFLLDMQKDTVVHTISSVMLDPAGGNHPQQIRDITDVIVVTADGTQHALGLGGYLDIGINDTMKDLFVNFIGALVFSVIGFFYVKNRGKGPFCPAVHPPAHHGQRRERGGKIIRIPSARGGILEMAGSSGRSFSLSRRITL